MQTRAPERWLERMPLVYGKSVLEEDEPGESHEIATVRNFRSLMPLAHDARKPMFDLQPADGAIGSTQRYVQICKQEFRVLAEKVVERITTLTP